jgi:hypothetical protein
MEKKRRATEQKKRQEMLDGKAEAKCSPEQLSKVKSILLVEAWRVCPGAYCAAIPLVTNPRNATAPHAPLAGTEWPCPTPTRSFLPVSSFCDVLL